MTAVALVLFDLDGTLADTAPDLAGAVNRMLRVRGREPLPLADLRPVASHGARGLLGRAFGVAPADPGFEALRQEFFREYEGALCVEPSLFPAMDQALSELEGRGILWGIVTNKMARFTEPLVRALGLHERAACVVSGDTAPRPKPDPAPLLHALAATATDAAATTALKLSPMAVIILLGAWLLLSEPVVYTRHPPTTPLTLADLMAASTIALFAMLGIESAAVPAGRVRDPERTIPRATMVGTLLTAGIYILVSSIALLLIPQQELAQSNAPFADLLDAFMGAGNGRVLAVFVVISGLGALNGWTLLVGELTATMARHGSLPTRLALVNSRGAPALALVLTGVFATAMVLMNYKLAGVPAQECGLAEPLRLNKIAHESLD